METKEGQEECEAQKYSRLAMRRLVEADSALRNGAGILALAQDEIAAACTTGITLAAGQSPRPYDNAVGQSSRGPRGSVGCAG